MRVKMFGNPIAGEEFRFDITDFESIARVEVTLDDQMLKSMDCPHPPCHDIVRIPDTAFEKVLTVSVRDDKSHVTQILKVLGSGLIR